jgi:ribose transport system permease protein
MTETAATEERGGTALRERLSEFISQLAAAGALIVVFVFLSFASPVFLSADNLFNIGSQTAVTAVIAIGMTLVIITAGIDLSVGSVSALSGVLGVMMMAQAGLPVPVAIIGGTLVGAICGLVNGLLVSVAGLNPFIATLGMLTVARGLTFIFTNAVAVFGAPASFRLLGQGVIGPIPIPILVIAGSHRRVHSALAHPARALRLRDGLEPGGRPALGDPDPALPDERVRDLRRSRGLRRHDSRLPGQLRTT